MNLPTLTALHYTRRDNIAILTIDFPPVNALGAAVLDDLKIILRHAAADPSVDAIIITGSNNIFISGADIRGFGVAKPGATAAEIQLDIETSSKPIVAVINGTALGGGLELALTAQYRIASPNAMMGFPEVNLGLLPGGGGTQRATRLAGPEIALELILSGRQITAKEALQHGLIDRISEGDLIEQAVTFAQQQLRRHGPLPNALQRTDKIANIPSTFFEDARQRAKLKWRGMAAPPKIIGCIEAACSFGRDGLELERSAFAECMRAPSRPALVHLFFAERAARKYEGIQEGRGLKPISSVGIVGAGTMGSGIAIALANAGLTVQLVDNTQSSLERARDRIRSDYAISLSRGSITQAAIDAALQRITFERELGAIAQSDLAIEAVFEDLSAKQAVFRDLDEVMQNGAILASNTSSLDIDAIASVTRRADKVIGLHFFSPANVMRLLEIVQGKFCGAATIAAAMAFSKQIGKIAVLAGNSEGFIGNRILRVYGREADFLLEEGATPWQIDDALQEFGFPMGLFRMRDLAGLDIAWAGRKQKALTRDPSQRYSPIADKICELGRFGQKSGAGYYKYSGREASPDPEIEALIADISQARGIRRQPVSSEEIIERLLCAMVNEGCFVLDDGIARRASDIDLTYVYGYGFPKYRGGPMFWAEQQGLDKIYQSVLRFQASQGERWTPSPRLQQLVNSGGGWTSVEPG